MSKMLTEIKTYTINDPKYINKVLEAFFNAIPSYRVHIVDIDVTFETRSVDKIEMLRNKGFMLNVKTKFIYCAKKAIDGLPIEISAISKGNKNYKAKGIQVHVRCVGNTAEGLETDVMKKERLLIRYLNKFEIPVDRVCVAGSLECVYKFGSPAQTCETMN